MAFGIFWEAIVPFLGLHKLYKNRILSPKVPVFHIPDKLVNVFKGEWDPHNWILNIGIRLESGDSLHWSPTTMHTVGGWGERSIQLFKLSLRSRLYSTISSSLELNLWSTSLNSVQSFRCLQFPPIDNTPQFPIVYALEYLLQLQKAHLQLLVYGTG